MRKILFSLLLGFQFVVHGQAPSLEKTVLWEVSGKDWQKPSYLFGTMHLLCEQDAKLSDSLRFTIDQAEKVYFELDMDNTLEMLGMIKHMRMKGEVRLSDLLSEGEYEKVKQYFAQRKSILPLSMMERFKPFFISALLQQQTMPCEKQDGMESVIMKYAKRQGKEIKGLETMAFQASIFDSIPYAEQAKALVQSIDSADKQDNSMRELMQVYLDQDLDRMYALTTQEELGMEGALDLLLFNRNARWVDRMQELSGSTTYIYAVGAGHLPGEKGLIQLLRNRGYRVRPMQHVVIKGNLALIR